MDIIQRLAAQLSVLETQLTESGNIFFLVDKTNLIFNFQERRPYIRPDINAPRIQFLVIGSIKYQNAVIRG